MCTFIQFGHPGSSESTTAPDMDHLCWPTHPQAALELRVLNCELCLLHRALYDDNCLDSQIVCYNSHNKITNGLIIAAVISLAKANFPGTCRSRSYTQEIYLLDLLIYLKKHKLHKHKHTPVTASVGRLNMTNDYCHCLSDTVILVLRILWTVPQI